MPSQIELALLYNVVHQFPVLHIILYPCSHLFTMSYESSSLLLCSSSRASLRRMVPRVVALGCKDAGRNRLCMRVEQRDEILLKQWR